MEEVAKNKGIGEKSRSPEMQVLFSKSTLVIATTPLGLIVDATKRTL